jgi:hypothetical protein
MSKIKKFTSELGKRQNQDARASPNEFKSQLQLAKNRAFAKGRPRRSIAGAVTMLIIHQD